MKHVIIHKAEYSNTAFKETTLEAWSANLSSLYNCMRLLMHCRSKIHVDTQPYCCSAIDAVTSSWGSVVLLSKKFRGDGKSDMGGEKCQKSCFGFGCHFLIWQYISVALWCTYPIWMYKPYSDVHLILMSFGCTSLVLMYIHHLDVPDVHLIPMYIHFSFECTPLLICMYMYMTIVYTLIQKYITRS